jgi:hypothetical protein
MAADAQAGPFLQFLKSIMLMSHVKPCEFLISLAASSMYDI